MSSPLARFPFLFSGVFLYFFSIAMVNALCFTAHGQVVKQFSDKHSVSTHFFAGAAAGACQAFVVSPMVRGEINLILMIHHI